MNNYRRFKYPFGGTGYVDPSNPTPDLQTILAYQDNLPVARNTGGVQLVNDPSQYLQEYTERVRPDLERKVAEVKKQYSNVPKGGTIVRNHDKLYDYYKDGDKLYYRKKGGKNWIDISDNDVAQKRINATIARNKRTYGKSKIENENTRSSAKATSEENVPVVTYTPSENYYDIRKAIENSASKDKLRTKRNNEIIYGKNSDYFKRYSIYGDKYKTPSNKSNKHASKPSTTRSGNPVTAINNSIFKNLYGNQERVNDVIRQGGAKSYKEYLNTPPAPTGYPKQAVIKQAPPKWRGR